MTFEDAFEDYRRRTGSEWSKRLPTQEIEPKPRDSFKGPSRSDIYESQREAGDQVFEKIRAQLEASSARRFSRFEVFVMPANFTTLHAQTERRLADFVSASQQRDPAFFSDFPRGSGIGTTIFRAVRTEQNDAVFERLRKAAADDTTLVLMIHDEAHYGATAGGAVDHYLNHDSLLGRPNVVQLLVSATPYNLQTMSSQIPQSNETDWPRAEEGDYYGLQRYCEASRGKQATEGVICADDDFELHCKKVLAADYDTGGVRGKDNAEKAARRDALIEEYICAMMKHEGLDIPSGKVSRRTEMIVNDLLDIPLTRGDGSGIMVVIRVCGKTQGILLKDRLETTRRSLGLDDRFAVVLDISEETGGHSRMSDSIGKVLLQRMSTWNDHKEPKFRLIDPKSYEDLLDLPMVLILCEKGKMGDSFPRSFRHYDLRLRYSKSCEFRAAVEQDLGRAFRYGPATPDYPYPTILVGKVCAAELTRQKVNLLRLTPDPKMTMRRATGSAAKEKEERTMFDGKPISAAHPAEVEESSAKYRKYWKCAERHARHYDSKPYSVRKNRFLLQGRPQIGKTGAFLHLIERLFYYVNRKPRLPPLRPAHASTVVQPTPGPPREPCVETMAAVENGIRDEDISEPT
jgi:hypothetical protein